MFQVKAAVTNTVYNINKNGFLYSHHDRTKHSSLKILTFLKFITHLTSSEVPENSFIASCIILAASCYNV